MKIDLSKKITEYAKKILVIILIIHICILSIGNAHVNAATDDELRDYFNEIKDIAAWPGKYADWENLKGKDYVPNNLDNDPYHTLDDNRELIKEIAETERAILYLLDDYNKTGVKKSDDEIYAVGDGILDQLADGTIAHPNWEQLLNNYAGIIDSVVKDANLSKRVDNPREITITEPPAEESEELGETDNALLDFLDGIAGVLFIGFKIGPIIIGGAIELIMNISSGEQITIFNLLFNKVGLTDINFFQRASRK